jgi:hypothetical protein
VERLRADRDPMRGETMSATGLDVFGSTLHKTNRWLNDLMHVLD